MSRAYRLSDSSMSLLHKCERLYQLDRLLAGAPEKHNFPATVLGKAWGAGVASYMTYQNIEKALYACWLAYSPKLEDLKRTEAVALNMLEASVPAMDLILQDWEIVFFNDKPAVELSFRLNIDENYYYVGYLDFVLRNKYTGRVAVFDAKSTAMQLEDLSPLYQNSAQLIGYSIVLDQIVGEELSEYDVFYFSGKLGSGNGFSPVIRPYQFSKTLQDRLHWFISLGMDVNHLKEMASLSIYPQRGGSCLQYNKPCKHFGTCSLFGLDRPAELIEDPVVYDFTYSLDAVIENHLGRI